jgi:hypothetical protein
MGILSDIQNELVDNSAPIGPALLKLRLLASRLGSAPLADWVKHESEGYPQRHELPDYRKLAMAFSGTFSGAFGSGIRNAPIPPYLISKIAGEHWAMQRMRESASAIDSMLESKKGIQLDLSNLALLIQGKIYEDYACNQLVGFISHSAIVELSNAIRNRVLEVTIGLEREIPNAGSIELAGFNKAPELATRIVNQTVYGNVTSFENTGSNVQIGVSIVQGDKPALIGLLREAGLHEAFVTELADAIAADAPEAAGSLGQRAAKWIGKKISDGVDLGIKGGVSAAVNLAQAAAMQYWGLK